MINVRPGTIALDIIETQSDNHLDQDDGARIHDHSARSESINQLENMG
jgi:hypothetical protein